MAKYHILFGFDESDIVRTIVNAIKSQRHEVEFATAVTKHDIRDYLHRKKTVTTLILREVMGTESFSAEELAQLNDTNNYNIVVVVDSSHRGQPFMQVLYSAGITSAILLSEKSGATPATIADLVLNQRSRKKARDYYGMSNVNIKVDLLTSDIYTEKLALLMNEAAGFNLIDRFVQVVRQLTVNQAVEFTAKLPPNMKRDLMEYEEYYKVLEYFKRHGYKVATGKRPKNLKKGLSDEVFLAALSSGKRVASRKLEQKNRVPVQKAVPNAVTRQPKLVSPRLPETPKMVQSEPLPASDSVSENEMRMASMLGVDNDVLAQTSVQVPNVQMTENIGTTDGNVTEQDSVNPPNNEYTGDIVNGNTVSTKETANSKKVRVVGTSSAFNKGKKKKTKSRSKTKISWKTLLIILVFGIICLILWYFLLALGQIM